ncbi:hypothetical protein MPSEU_000987400 [Mayamaea pseudoterrestris]|nr:hypothetical protein MPSEU_000987400 [Mayamaea pseudoterrestris]
MYKTPKKPAAVSARTSMTTPKHRYLSSTMRAKTPHRRLTTAKKSRKVDFSMGEEPVKVAIRMRPLCGKEDESVWQVDTDANTVMLKEDGAVFEFHKAFDGEATTEDVYEAVAKSIVTSSLSGFNGAIMTYGQTSSGKTFTMQGSGTIADGTATKRGGIIHMAASDIFQHIQSTPERIFSVRVSFLEVYNEEIRDLLSPDSKTLQVREDQNRRVFVQDAKEESVDDFDSLLELLAIGEKSRQFAKTNMNQRSSRSHTIFRITIESQTDDDEGEDSQQSQDSVGGPLKRVSTLDLVDLAGSEGIRHNGKKKTGQENRQTEECQKKRQTEGGSINKSLLALSTVIRALGEETPFLNYRDSKLTRVLQPSLSGNTRLAFICCASSSKIYSTETQSTLDFACCARTIKTRAQVNRQPAEPIFPAGKAQVPFEQEPSASPNLVAPSRGDEIFRLRDITEKLHAEKEATNLELVRLSKLNQQLQADAQRQSMSHGEDDAEKSAAAEAFVSRLQTEWSIKMLELEDTNKRLRTEKEFAEKRIEELRLSITSLHATNNRLRDDRSLEIANQKVRLEEMILSMQQKDAELATQQEAIDQIHIAKQASDVKTSLLEKAIQELRLGQKAAITLSIQQKDEKIAALQEANDQLHKAKQASDDKANLLAKANQELQLGRESDTTVSLQQKNAELALLKVENDHLCIAKQASDDKAVMLSKTNHELRVELDAQNNRYKAFAARKKAEIEKLSQKLRDIELRCVEQNVVAVAAALKGNGKNSASSEPMSESVDRLIADDNQTGKTEMMCATSDDDCSSDKENGAPRHVALGTVAGAYDMLRMSKPKPVNAQRLSLPIDPDDLPIDMSTLQIPYPAHMLTEEQQPQSQAEDCIDPDDLPIDMATLNFPYPAHMLTEEQQPQLQAENCISYKKLLKHKGPFVNVWHGQDIDKMTPHQAHIMVADPNDTQLSDNPHAMIYVRYENSREKKFEPRCTITRFEESIVYNAKTRSQVKVEPEQQRALRAPASGINDVVVKLKKEWKSAIDTSKPAARSRKKKKPLRTVSANQRTGPLKSNVQQASKSDDTQLRLKNKSEQKSIAIQYFAKLVYDTSNVRPDEEKFFMPMKLTEGNPFADLVYIAKGQNVNRNHAAIWLVLKVWFDKEVPAPIETFLQKKLPQMLALRAATADKKALNEEALTMLTNIFDKARWTTEYRTLCEFFSDGLAKMKADWHPNDYVKELYDIYAAWPVDEGEVRSSDRPDVRFWKIHRREQLGGQARGSGPAELKSLVFPLLGFK